MSNLTDFAERYRAFHEEQSRRRDENLNETNLKIALDQRESEAKRGIPINYWSFEIAIADAARVTTQVRSEQARAGGKAPKRDALQQLVVQFARENPGGKTPELLTWLRLPENMGVIDEVESSDLPKPSIHFYQKGRIEQAPISGLKDRLARAKKINRN